MDINVISDLSASTVRIRHCVIFCMLAQQLIVPLRWGFYFNDCTEEECKSWSCHKNQIYKVGSLRSCCFHPIRSHWANMNHTQTLTVAGQKDVRLFERMWSFFVEKVEFPAVVVAMNSTFLHVDQRNMSRFKNRLKRAALISSMLVTTSVCIRFVALAQDDDVPIHNPTYKTLKAVSDRNIRSISFSERIFSDD